MKQVKVKREQEEKSIGNLTLNFNVLNVCEAEKEDGETKLEFYQIYNVTEVWKPFLPKLEVESA